MTSKPNKRMDASAHFVVAARSEKNFSFSAGLRRLAYGVRMLAALTIAFAAAPAAADRPIEVDADGVPFSAHDLADAIRVRVAHEGHGLRVRVTAAEGGVRVEAHGGSRDVALEGLQGPAAARLVALAANDLWMDDLAVAPAAPVERRATVSLVGSAAGWGNPLGGLTADLALPVGPGLVAIEAGASNMLGGSVDLTGGVVRVSGGWRSSWLELRAGATVMPIVVSTGAGDTTVLVGAGASARVRLPISGGVRGVIAGGADAFATRTTYQLAGMPAFATPAIAPWLGAGVEAAL
jgi:hypothetical protein